MIQTVITEDQEAPTFAKATVAQGVLDQTTFIVVQEVLSQEAVLADQEVRVPVAVLADQEVQG